MISGAAGKEKGAASQMGVQSYKKTEHSNELSWAKIVACDLCNIALQRAGSSQATIAFFKRY